MPRVPQLPGRAKDPVLGRDALGRAWGSGFAGGLRPREGGANARMGLATLVAGTVVVNTSAVAANSRIFLTTTVPNGTVGFLRVSARVAGVSFTILSSSGTDTSQVAWLLVEPG